VDVSVVDRLGRPVRGLAASDFTMFENGQPRDVVGFAEVLVPAEAPAPAPWLRDVPPDVRSNDVNDGRLFAIVMDDATMPPDLRITANARQIGRGVIDRMGPADLAAVIFVNDSRRSVDFTNDRKRLLTAIDGLTPGFAYADDMPRTNSQFFFASIRTVGLVAARLTHVPQRRKAVIYVSTGVPVEPSTIAKAGQLAPQTAASATVQDDTTDDTTDDEIQNDLVNALGDLLEEKPQEAYGAALQDAYIRAQDGNVNVYSIDPGGLGGMQSFLQAHGRSRLDPAQLMAPDEAVSESRLYQDYLVAVAKSSGGRAFVNTNDIDTSLSQIFEENSAYYLIGYESSRDPNDRRLRRVTVGVKQPDLIARTRNAYIRPNDAPKPTTVTELGPLLASTLAEVLPNPGVALRASSGVFALPDGKGGVAVALGINQPVVGDRGARVNEQLDVLATAFSPDGKPRAWFRQTVHVGMRAGLPDASYEVISRLDLPPGSYQLRLAAHSAMTGKTGSVYLDVVVPDFRREPLSVSDLVLWARPSRVAAPADAAAAFLPVIPTGRRVFREGDTVGGFLRIYQSANRPAVPVTVTITITDGDNNVVGRSIEGLGAEQFSSGQVDYRLSLPITSFAPGEYLLTLDAATADRAARRYVRFVVQ
jgi:VWFA-related protein